MVDLTDLVTAWLDLRRYRAAHPELATYYANRYPALAAAFGAPLDLGPPKSSDEALYRLLQRTVDTYERTASPFAVYLEAPPPIVDLHREHAGSIDTGVDLLRAALFRLVLDLVGVLWSLPPEMTVEPEELRYHGFDPLSPQPDPLDFV
jgi:hypothetical protein